MRQQRIDRLINTPNNDDFFGDSQTDYEYNTNVGLPNRFSDDNPYAQQFAFARNKQDLFAFRNSAIEWEANRQSVLEQRAYEDPRAQLQRQRAAGLNPDLAASGGGSALGAGSSATMAQASPDIENAYNPLEQANAVMSGIANGTAAIASITSAMSGVLDFVRSVKTFDDAVSASASQASLLKTAADVSAQTKDSQILAAKAAARSADVSAGIAEGTQYTTINLQNAANEARRAQLDRQELNEYQAMASQYASIFDPSATDPEIEAQLLEEGFHDGQVQVLVPRIRHFLAHPESKAKFDDAVVAQREASAKRKVRSLEFFTRLQENISQVEQLSSETALYRSTFENSFAQLFYTDENAEQSASIATTNLGNEQLQSVYNQEELQQKLNVLRNDAAAYFEKLDQAKQLTIYIDKEIAALRKSPMTDETYTLLLSLQTQRMQIASACQAELDKIYQHFATAMHTSYTGSRQLAFGKVVPLSSSLNVHTTRFSQFLWRDYVNSTSGEEQPKSILESLLSTVAGKLMKSE